jgi:prepilin-type N-terminal cleavage/methylation domain-containing protein
MTMLRAIGTIRTRLAREESGFSMIELLIVSSIIGILTSIATPSYLGFKDSANKAAASANVAAIIPDVEWYAFDNYPGSPAARDPDYNGSDAAYTGTNADSGYSDASATDFLSLLQTRYDSSLDPTAYTWDPAGWLPGAGLTTATDYCLYTVVGTWYAAKHGPNGAITKGQTMHLGANGDCYAS